MSISTPACSQYGDGNEPHSPCWLASPRPGKIPLIAKWFALWQAGTTIALSPNSVVRTVEQNPGQRATRQRTSIAGERQSRASARIRILNGKRLRTGAGNSFSRLPVKQVRNRLGIPTAKDPDTEPTVDAH